MRSILLKQALSVSMESADPLENEELNPVTETTTVAVDEILEEVRDQEDVVEEHDEAVEELTGAAESLESLITSLESAIADGGMSPQSADIHSRALAIATRRLPIDANDYTVSTESFGGTGDKLTASMEALEGAKKLLSDIWNAIKTTVVNAYKAVVNFVRTIGKSAAALTRAGKILIAQAGQLEGSPKTAEIDATGVAKYLHKDGSLKTSVGAGLMEIVSKYSGVAQSASIAKDEIIKLVGATASGRLEKNEFAEAHDKIIKALPVGELPGGRVIETDDVVPKLVIKTNLKADTNNVKTPSAQDIKSIGQSIIKVAEKIGEFDKKHFVALEKAIDKAVAEQDRLVKKMDFETDKFVGGTVKGKEVGVRVAGEDKKAVRQALNDFRKISHIARSVGPAYMSYAAGAAKAAFSFGKKAVAAYK